MRSSVVKHFVIIRDDDVSALTPVEYLDILYRPFIERKIPVNLAVIPFVNTHAKTSHGHKEEFLLAQDHFAGRKILPRNIAIGTNRELVNYLLDNKNYYIAQHGYQHDYSEFSMENCDEITRRLDTGMNLLVEAGFDRPTTFVAPHDIMSCTAISEVAKRYPIISKYQYKIGQIPYAWWPSYIWWTKIIRSPHWKHNETFFLSRPLKTYLSSRFPIEDMFDSIVASIQSRTLTVLHTHWWAFFKHPHTSADFIAVLHRVADYLAQTSNVRAVFFKDLLTQEVLLN